MEMLTTSGAKLKHFMADMQALHGHAEIRSYSGQIIVNGKPLPSSEMRFSLTRSHLKLLADEALVRVGGFVNLGSMRSPAMLRRTYNKWLINQSAQLS